MSKLVFHLISKQRSIRLQSKVRHEQDKQTAN